SLCCGRAALRATGGRRAVRLHDPVQLQLLLRRTDGLDDRDWRDCDPGAAHGYNRQSELGRQVRLEGDSARVSATRPGDVMEIPAYFTTAGTGMTYFPSFSATKFSVELLELPLASLDSMLIFNFLVGVSGSFALLPSGPVCTSDAFFTSSGVR